MRDDSTGSGPWISNASDENFEIPIFDFLESTHICAKYIHIYIEVILFLAYFKHIVITVFLTRPLWIGIDDFPWIVALRFNLSLIISS